MRLDVVRARVGRIGDEGDRFRRARITHVDHGEAVAEHVPDDGVAIREHHLRAVGASALIAAAEKADVLARHRRIGLLTAHAMLRSSRRKRGTLDLQ